MPTVLVPKAIDGTDAVYVATWAVLVAVYRHNLSIDTPIRTVALPAMGAGFGNVSYTEVARQMATAYDNFLHPPSQLDWDVIIERQRRVSYDGDRKVVR